MKDLLKLTFFFIFLFLYNLSPHTDALTRYCDLTSTVRKTVLPKLALYATSKDQQTKLMFLASTEGREEYQNNIALPGRTIIELMEKFSSLKIPLCDFLELVPRLMSRGMFLFVLFCLFFFLRCFACLLVWSLDHHIV